MIAPIALNTENATPDPAGPHRCAPAAWTSYQTPWVLRRQCGRFAGALPASRATVLFQPLKGKLLTPWLLWITKLLPICDVAQGLLWPLLLYYSHPPILCTSRLLVLILLSGSVETQRLAGLCC